MYEEKKKKNNDLFAVLSSRQSYIFFNCFFLHTHISLRNDAIIQDYYYAGMRMKMTIDRRWIPGRGGEKERKKERKNGDDTTFFRCSSRVEGRAIDRLG